MDELVDFYERYIAAFNALDAEAFAGFFHLPVMYLGTARPDERGRGLSLGVITEPQAMLSRLPAHWARSTIESISALDDLGVPLDFADAVKVHGPRHGLVANVTRWNKDGEPYQRIRALYLLTRDNGQLGLKVIAELAVVNLASGRSGADTREPRGTGDG